MEQTLSQGANRGSIVFDLGSCQCLHTYNPPHTHTLCSISWTPRGTCAGFAIASKARHACAAVPAGCVGAVGVRAAVMGARTALIHVWQAVYRGVEIEHMRGVACLPTQ
jgi:hypothetical protein